MKEQNAAGIIFDMDGTLWDSSENVARSWSTVTEKTPGLEKALTKDDLQSVMGRTMDKIAEALFSALPAEKQRQTLERCCEAENTYLREHGGILYDGVEQTLKALKEKYRLFIVSNCQAGYIEAFLDHYGLWKYFDDIECFGNNGKPKDENIRRIYERNRLQRAVYVGDIQGDYDASVRAGIGFIHARYGFGQIGTEVPFIASFRELPAVADEVFG